MFISLSFSVDFNDLGKRKYFLSVFLNQKAHKAFIEHVLGTSFMLSNCLFCKFYIGIIFFECKD